MREEKIYCISFVISCAAAAVILSAFPACRNDRVGPIAIGIPVGLVEDALGAEVNPSLGKRSIYYSSILISLALHSLGYAFQKAKKLSGHEAQGGAPAEAFVETGLYGRLLGRYYALAIASRRMSRLQAMKVGRVRSMRRVGKLCRGTKDVIEGVMTRSRLGRRRRVVSKRDGVIIGRVPMLICWLELHRRCSGKALPACALEKSCGASV